MGWTRTEYCRSLRVESCKPDSNATYLSQQAIPQQTYNLFTPNIHLTIMRGKNRVTACETYSNRNRFLFNVRLEWNDVTSLEKKQRNGRVEVKQRLRRRRKATKTRENWPNEKWELDAKHPLQMSVSDWYELWLTSHVIAHYAEHVCIVRNATHVPYMYHCNDVILYSLAAKVEKSITLLHWKTVEKFGRQIEWTSSCWAAPNCIQIHQDLWHDRETIGLEAVLH